jgi:AraC family transcriptional regulator
MATTSIPQPVRFQDGEAMVFAGLAESYTPATLGEIPKLWQRFVPYLGSIPKQVGTDTYGVVSGTRSGGDRFDYLAGVRIENGNGLPQEFAQFAAPAQTYAVFRHYGPVSKLAATCHAVWTEWLPGSGFDPAARPDFIEVYGERFDPQAGAGEVEIWLPVRAPEADAGT